jgi:hypothetical protein
MKSERSDVEFPVWRKKVDKTLFHWAGTVVPEWACKDVEFSEYLWRCQQQNSIHAHPLGSSIAAKSTKPG